MPETDKTLTIHNGATFEIKSNGKIETIGNGKIRNGTIDIKNGAIVIGENVDSTTDDEAIKTFLKSKISNHIVIYKGETIKEHL
jgi:hypothetical protein